MVRRLVEFFNGFLPDKAATEQFLPWLTLLIGSGAALVGLIQYAGQNASAKVVQSIKMHDEYSGSDASKDSLKDVHFRLTLLNADLGRLIDETRCSFILSNKSLAAQVPNPKSIDCKSGEAAKLLKAVDLDNEQRRLLREEINRVQKQRLQYDERTRSSITKILHYFLRVVACVENGGCDRRTALDLFGSDMLSFINAHCVFINDIYSEWGEAPLDIPIVKFLKQKPGIFAIQSRPIQLRCEHHRRL